MKQNKFSIPNPRGKLFKLLDNPGPGQYQSRSSSPIPGVTPIKLDINPQATYMNRIVEYNYPGPSDYAHSIDFGARYKNYLDIKPVY